MKDKKMETSETKPLKINKYIRRFEQLDCVRAVRGGLINLIPILIIGAFALVLKDLPIDGYTHFIENFAGGVLEKIFLYVNTATFGVLSVYMTYSISRSYMKVKADPDTVNGGAVFASLVAFFILSGAFLDFKDFGEDAFGSKQMGVRSMVLAIVAGLGASSLYLKSDRFFRRRRQYLFSPGADREFNRMLASFLPILVVAVVFGVLNAIVLYVSDAASIHDLYIRAMNGLFSPGGDQPGFFKGFFFVLMSSVLWFFGVHGSDALQGVMNTYFEDGLANNAILSKPFFDCFVLMGGCGTTICLLIALLAFSRNRAERRLGLTAAFPMIFNINELMVFGLPIVFNPIMLIPFLTVPLVCYSVSYLAVYSGLVPRIAESVDWTTPILLGGFKACGIRGLLLQLFLVLIGVAIYFPFVRFLDRESERRSRLHFNAFMEYFREHEQELYNKRVTDLDNVYGDVAKTLCADLRDGLYRNIVLYYQPQYHYDGRCIGVEALLRWNHPVHGVLYPPLVVKLATESNLLARFEEAVIERAIADRPAVLRRFGDDVKLSVNVTGTTVATPRFIQFCRNLNQTFPFEGKNICLEVTEQTALDLGEETRRNLNELRSMGLLLAIDDFSMGQTSLHYLKDNLFDIIKIDGSLVSGLFTGKNCREIISSITGLADSLSLPVIAEFVETEEQKEILHEIGCDRYQGYLFSPAVPLE